MRGFEEPGETVEVLGGDRRETLELDHEPVFEQDVSHELLNRCAAKGERCVATPGDVNVTRGDLVDEVPLGLVDRQLRPQATINRIGRLDDQLPKSVQFVRSFRHFRVPSSQTADLCAKTVPNGVRTGPHVDGTGVTSCANNSYAVSKGQVIPFGQGEQSPMC